MKYYDESFDYFYPNEDNQFIPLVDVEYSKDKKKSKKIPDVLPILPLRNTVLFPSVVIPINAIRSKSVDVLKKAYEKKGFVGVVTQKDPLVKDPKAEDINNVGTVAKVIKVLRMPDESVTAIIQGYNMFKINKIVQYNPYIKVNFTLIDEVKPTKISDKFKALVESLKDLSIKIIRDNPNIPIESTFPMQNIDSPWLLVNYICSNAALPVKEKQDLLENNNFEKRATLALKYLTVELKRIKLKNDIQSKVKTDIDQQQKEYFLHQQMKTIQEELGDDSYKDDTEELNNKAKSKKWTSKVKEIFEKELNRMSRIPNHSAEYSVQRNYVDLILDMPWLKVSKDNFDIKKASAILDRDHFGMENIKNRILEYISVIKIKNNMKSPIICLQGPPGVGKTSLAKSIANALGRKYVRMSLGGIRDEVDIKGHRRTYIGAMPGRIIQLIKKAGVSNPVFVLDEIDKMVNNNFSGDPSSALLEALDPEQNNKFHDNYLDIDYDLSNVMFIATSNDNSTIQPPLLDRMEVIELNGYSVEEKLDIAKRHLLPKQLSEHGLTKKDVSISKKQFEYIIDNYTRESGVRSLERKIAKIMRNISKFIVSKEKYNPKLNDKDIEKILGIKLFRRDMSENNDYAGVVTGLAWTPTGGDILFIESTISEGTGKLNVTGNLGEVMKESAIIAMEYIKSNADYLSIPHKIFSKCNIHIHVPEGATPKDGPSAGIAMITSLISTIKQKKVKKNLAMTGEITLRGKVLPIGGVKEKILSAKRSNIKEVILPKENERNVEEINKNHIKDLKFHYVDNIKEVVDISILDKDVVNAKKVL